MVDINPTISIITFNVNGLNAAIKIQRLSAWIKKQDLIVCCLQETHFKYKYYIQIYNLYIQIKDTYLYVNI